MARKASNPSKPMRPEILGAIAYFISGWVLMNIIPEACLRTPRALRYLSTW